MEDYLTTIYDGVRGYVSYQPGEKEESEKSGIFLTYGEILYTGLESLLANIPLNERDVFLDLGSGIGKAALQCFLSTPIHGVLGIEAHEERHNYAIDALTRLQQDMPEMFQNDRFVRFLHGNFLELEFNQATVLFTCSTCFGQHLLDSIGQKINKAPNIRYAMSLKPLENLTRLTLKDTVTIDCTWDVSSCYIYSLPN